MARPRRQRGFMSSVVVPLLAGTALTVGGLFALATATGVPLWATNGAEKAGTSGAPEDVAMASEVVGPPDRNVTPIGVTPGPRAEGLMVRVAPNDPAVGALEAQVRFRRVVVLDGAHFRTIFAKRPILVRLAGIQAPEFRDICTDPDGKTWKCGARARAELARLILNRSVSCVIVDDSEPATPVGRCQVGVYDLSDWMVRGGWADPSEDAGPSLQDAAAEAKRQLRGRFGPAPTGVIAG